MTPMLEIQSASKGYGNGRQHSPVLKDINLRIDEGEFVAIIGYSGAGKTTLMSLLAGLLAPDEGRVTFRGQRVTAPGPERALVFQNYSLLPWLSVRGNIALAVDSVHRGWPASRRRQHVDRYIEMVNLTPARHKKPHELSGGMRQRVSVARALAMEPRVLLMDEPLSALDALTRATLQDEISRIWQETRKTMVLITNDPDEGIYLADRIIPLSAGPSATLGPSIPIDIPRPRDRRDLNKEPHFIDVRRRVLDYLLGDGGRAKTTVTRKLVLPDLEPEDLTRPHGMPFIGSRARRRREEKQETVEIS